MATSHDTESALRVYLNGQAQCNEIRVLLVEDNPHDHKLFAAYLANTSSGANDIVHVERCDAAIKRLGAGDVDVIVLDLDLPDSHGIETILAVHHAAPTVPIVVLTGNDDEELGPLAVQCGAEDFLVKGRVEPDVLVRSIRYAIERAKLKINIRDSEKRCRQLVDQATDAIFVIDRDAHIMDVNRRACVTLGYQQKELHGMNLADVDLEFDETTLAEIGRTISDGGSLTLDHTFQRKDGQGIPMEVRVGLFECNGDRFLLCQARDINDRIRRRWAEDMLRADRQEFRIVERIQQNLFPVEPPDIQVYDVSGASSSVDSASGDFYDWFPMADGYTGVVVGDASGSGMGPALLMAQTRAYLRALSQSSSDLRDITGRLNELLRADTGQEQFVAFFFARLDPKTYKVVYTGAGHFAHVSRASGDVQFLETSNIPAGIAINGEPIIATLELEAGDMLVMHTDGLTNAENDEGNWFGRRRLLDAVHQNRSHSTAEIVTSVYQEIHKFTAQWPFQDDMTVVVIKAGQSLQTCPNGQYKNDRDRLQPKKYRRRNGYYRIHQSDDVAVVKLSGTAVLEPVTTRELAEALAWFVESEKPQKLLIDFGDVKRCSTETINGLLRIRKRSFEFEVDAKFCNMQPLVRDVFRLLKLNGTVFDIYDTPADALNAFR